MASPATDFPATSSDARSANWTFWALRPVLTIYGRHRATIWKDYRVTAKINTVSASTGSGEYASDGPRMASTR